MTDLALMQLARVKGMLSADAAAQSLGIDRHSAAEAFDRLEAEDFVTAAPRGFRLTRAGREKTAALIADERESLDIAAFKGVYEDFCEINAELKATMTDWQMRDPETPNDHADAGYDAAVIERLAGVHGSAMPVLDRIVQLAPRLGHYPGRLQGALARAQGGDNAYVARPLIDSYHTVWFELHEDLMAVLGLTRAEEAGAGRAQ